MNTRFGACLIVAAALTATTVGCGLGPGERTGGLTLTVTDGFGTRQVAPDVRGAAPGEETAMRQLRRSRKVETRYDGRYVEAIDGLSGGTVDGRQVDWFYFVNGVESPVGAAEKTLHPGDSVWWDRRDWGQATNVPAVVGQWPEPFRSGVDGKRLAVRLVCPPGEAAACRDVASVLERIGVRVGAGIAGVSGRGSGLRVVVGEWSRVRNDPDAATLARGPAVSGVYAVPSRDGRSLAVLDPQGRKALETGIGSGLIAATAGSDSPPVWIVTGIGSQGLQRAVRGLNPDVLSRRYAAVIAPSGKSLGAPIVGAAE